MTTKNSTGKKKNSTSKKTNLKNEIKELKEELKQKNDKLLRSIADLQNLQKRTYKELENKECELKEKYVSELIDLRDLLKKAINDEKPKQGLKLIIENIDNFFEKEGVENIDCIGKKFDHNLHHAITTIEKDECEDNTIVEEVKKGFMINNRVVRPSQVIVSKKK